MATVDRLVIQLDADLQRLKSALQKADNDTRRATESMAQRFDRLGKKMSEFGQQMSMKLSLPLAAVGGIGLKAAGDFETAMNRVQAVTEASARDFTRMRDLALELGNTTSFSGSQVAEAMGIMAQSGRNVEQILGGVNSVLMLAASAQMSIADATSIVVNIMTGFGMEVKQLPHAVDVLTKAFLSANTNLQDLGFAFSYAGGIAKSTDQTFEDTAAALALLANAGYAGEKGGTALRNIFTRLLNPTGAVKKAIEAAGLSFHQANGRLKPFRDIIAQLEPHMKDAALMMTIFEDRAGPGMMGILRQGLPVFDEMRAKLDNVGGTAQRVGMVQMQGFRGSVDQLMGALETLAIRIGDSGVLAFMTSMAKGAADVVSWMSQLHPKILLVGSAIAGLVAVVGPLSLALGLLSRFAIAPLVALLAPLVTGMIALGRAAVALGTMARFVGPIGTLVIALAGLKIVILQVAAASLVLLRRFLMWPAVFTAVLLAAKNLTLAVRNAWAAFMDGGKSASEAFATAFKESFIRDWQRVQSTVDGLFDSLISPKAEEAVRSDAEELGKSLQQTLAEAAQRAAVEAPMVKLGEAVGGGDDGLKARIRSAQESLEGLRIKALEAAGRNREAIEAEMAKELATYKAMLDEKLISTADYEKARANLRAIADKQLAELEDSSLKRLSDAMSAVSSNIENALSSAFDTGKFKAAEMVRAIIKDLMMLQIRAAVLQPLFGGGSAGGGGMIGQALSGIAGSIFHDGGVVGAGGPRRTVSPAAFIGAPRFHTGGFPGLKAGEVPTITRKGEVIDPGDGSVFAKVFGGRPIVFNVSTPDADSFRRSEGQITAMLARAVGRGQRNL